MRVLVIIPTKDRQEFLGEAIRSLQEQTVVPEIVTVGNVSYAGVPHLASSGHIAERLNEAIRGSDCDAFVILSDDDLLDKTFIEKTSRAMVNADLVYTDMEMFGGQRRIVRAKEFSQENVKNNQAPFITSLFSRSIWEKTGGFDNQVNTFIDWDFWYSCAEFGAKAIHIEEPLFKYRIHPRQTGLAGRSETECQAEVLDKRKVALITIATGKYGQFLPELVSSAKKFFIPHRFIIFTDGETPAGCLRVSQDHLGFPAITLKRYEIFLRQEGLLKQFEQVFYIDADSKFVAPVGKEVLSKMTVVQHRSFITKRGTYETRPESASYVREDEGTGYYCGGFNGGSEYLKMAREIKRTIELDEIKGVTAIWHDESHLNRYLINNPPEKVLSPSYMFPEGDNIPFEPKILNLQAYKKLR